MRRTALPLLALGLWLAAALLGPLLARDAQAIDLPRILHGPGAGAWLGRDDLGRPVGDRLLLGAGIALAVSVISVGVSLTLGGLLGTLAGWLGGGWERAFGRLTDVFLAFPGLLLALALAALLGPGWINTVAALSAVGWVGFARLARAQVRVLKQHERVQAARALGLRTPRLLWRHVLPFAAVPLLIEAAFALGGAVSAEAALSFLGLGMPPPAASWGGMIRSGAQYLLIAPHLLLAPAACLFAVVWAANRLGEAAQLHLNRRLGVVLAGRAQSANGHGGLPPQNMNPDFPLGA